MDYLLTLDWSSTFIPQLTLPEVLVRGTVVYFAVLGLLRVIPKWQAGPGSIASMLFVVLLGGLAADAVKGQAESVTDILLLIATVLFWVFIVDWLSYRLPWFHRLTQDSPTSLIRDGRILHKNLRRELITEEDLKTQLRRQDVEDISKVLEAELEADGSISVVKKKNDSGATSADTTSPVEAEGSPETDEPDRADARGPDESPQNNGRNPCGVHQAFAKVQDPSDHDDAELQAFLASAERLQIRLQWHEEQVASFKEALACHGIRVKPFTAAKRAARQNRADVCSGPTARDGRSDKA